MKGPCRFFGCCGVGAILLPALLTIPNLFAQDKPPSPGEVASHENEPQFKFEVQRNLVLVRVVVRDSKGQPVRHLRAEDFHLLDNGKPQAIVSFTEETPAASPKPESPESKTPTELAGQPESGAPAFTPLRYLALYFDDVHDNVENLTLTRDAAGRYLAQSLRPGDRVGVFTSSGQNTQDFTDNLSKLSDTLSRLQPRPIYVPDINPCPEIYSYQAYLIVERRDAPSVETATEEALLCRYNGDRRLYDQAQQYAEGEAVRVLTRNESQSEYSFRGLDQLVRRMGTLPGQRDIIFLSPGFLTETQKFEIGQIIDRALHSKVIINTFDSKGLFAPIPLGDASHRTLVTVARPDLVGQKAQNQITSYRLDVDVLSQLAQDTGGSFFENSNDYDLGFRRLGALVEAYYVLGFSPQNLKLDGRFHALKVALTKPERYALQARRGYFAPRKSQDEASVEKEDIEEAVFSQDEMAGLPVEVHTQFFKIDGQHTKLSVLAHLDLHAVRFHKAEGRNLNNVVFVTALFDRDGKYVTAQQRSVEFHLRDATLERLSKDGITTKASFDVAPGTYLLRQVVREAQGGQIAGVNRTVDIPF